MTAARTPELVAIPGGEFVMGKANGRDDERPPHRVTLAAFRAASRPVTNAEYAAFVAATGHDPAPFLSEARFSRPAQPAVGVSWFDAVAYCDWLAAETGLRARLPTEAEREYASLGGLEGVDWPWGAGDHPATATINAADGPHEPLDECANGYGLRCMAENVHEWCGDWYTVDYYGRAPQASPKGPASGKRRVSRGGAWRHKDKFTRVTARSSIPPEFRYSDYGFRIYADGD
ncbi:SUMF1/EgtB/PvdO family nonheme iron enzyme [bacterium]|nr:SUMF1/EgtB/PvdO family nonheme iron enzyme [bacterium]